ncbi:MAG: reverse transcriptase domain-containing protein [Candidatus Aminicenantales bacterium]
MQRESEPHKGPGYKEERKVGTVLQEVGGGHSTADGKDNKTLSEGRSPALAGAYSDEEGLVTAGGKSLLAQRTQKEVQVLQNTLRRAAKKEPGRRFGILCDKVCRWEVLWTSWIRVQRNKGTPQGGGLSPLLANIYLHPLDKYWAEWHPETKLVRYCDDLVILIRNREAEPYLQDLRRFVAKLKITLSEEKTRLVWAETGFDFLGAHLVLKPTRRDRNRKFCYGFPSPKSMKSIRKKIRAEIGRDYRKSLDEKIRGLNPVIRGWANYFNWLNSGEHFHKIERYVIQSLNRWNRRKKGGIKKSYRRLTGRDFQAYGLCPLHGTIAYLS